MIQTWLSGVNDTNLLKLQMVGNRSYNSEERRVPFSRNRRSDSRVTFGFGQVPGLRACVVPTGPAAPLPANFVRFAIALYLDTHRGFLW